MRFWNVPFLNLKNQGIQASVHSSSLTTKTSDSEVRRMRHLGNLLSGNAVRHIERPPPNE